MNRAAIFFLVLLRLAIGWHFFYEGIQKIHSVEVGETTTNRPFSSAAYFREAPGPAGSWVRAGTTGDPDAEVLALIKVEEPAGGSETPLPHQAMPKELRRRWEKILADYARHYQFTDEQRQKATAQLDQAGGNVVLWLTSLVNDPTSPELTRKFSSGEVKRRMAPAELITDYKAQLADLKQINDRKMWEFGKEAEKDHRARKAEVVARRTLLLSEVDKHTLAFVRSLNVLVAEPVSVRLLKKANDLLKKANDLLKDAKADAGEKPSPWQPWAADDPALKQVKQDRLKAVEDVAKTLKTILDVTADLEVVTPDELGATKVTPVNPKAMGATLKEQSASLADQSKELRKSAHGDEQIMAAAQTSEDLAKELAEAAAKLPGHEAPSLQTRGDWMVGWLDLLTRWGLTVIGLCLLVGLLSRTNAWLGAGFLLMTYLAVPPWPWLPAVGPSEGNYLFVNKNLVEMLALCVLGVTASGRAFGLDAILHWACTSLSKDEKN